MIKKKHTKKTKDSSFGKIGNKLILTSSLIVFITILLGGLSYYYTFKYGVEITIIVSISLAFIISLIASDLLSKSIVVPLRGLHSATKKIEKRDFSPRIKINTKDELQELGESFNKMAQALGRIDSEYKRIDKAKTKFLSITSHELRSPMTPIKAQIQILKELYLGKLNPKQQKSLEIILRNTNRLDKMIVDLLQISRIETARLKFEFKKTDIKKLILEFIEELDNEYKTKNIKIIPKLEKLPQINVDPDRLTEVLRNLLLNAKKFSKNNSKILLSAEAKKDHILFSVKDFGIGIKKENLSNIFEAFFQEEQTIFREYEGTGLGLTICKGIVESQNGKIWVKSTKRKGSTFYFTVPYIPVKNIKPLQKLFSSSRKI